MRGEAKLLKRVALSFVSLGVCIALNSLLYSYASKYTIERSEASEFLKTALDHAIPFVPFFVWLYVSFWMLIGMPFFIDALPAPFYLAVLYLRFFQKRLHPKRRALRRVVRGGGRIIGFIGGKFGFVFGSGKDFNDAKLRKAQIVLSYLCVIAISNLVFFLYPLKVIRPDIYSGENPVDMTIGFLRMLYEYDRPNNTLPSQHAAFSALAFFIFNRLRDTPIFFSLAFPWRRIKRRVPISAMGAVIGLWACGIILSTYFVKQHVIADSIAGVVVAYFAFRISFSERLRGKLEKLDSIIMKHG